MIFEYSYWWLIPVFIISGVVAWLKFKKISKLPDVLFFVRLSVTFLRFLSMFILSFLLLKPTLFLLQPIEEKPLLIVAQDNSASVLNNKDSLYYRTDYYESLQKDLAALEEKFTLEWLTFGKNVKKKGILDFSEHYTDISRVFKYVEDEYAYRKPEAMLLLSDGIYNTGVNPEYKVTSYPVYTVVLGDTTELPDVFIKEVECDKFNFLHTVFPVKVEVAALRQKGKSVKCILRDNRQKIGEKEIKINQDNFLEEVIFEVEANRSGMLKYTVELETGFQEQSRDNNRTTLYVNILDNSGEIDIYYSAPHPDIAAIASAINAAGIYTCETKDFKAPLTDARPNLIILHNPEPENPAYRNLVEKLMRRRVAVWYILTDREHISAFARSDHDYSFTSTSGLNEYVTPAYNRNFSYFEFTEQEINAYSAYPPLIEPFGEIRVNAGKSLFTQQIKQTDTENGLMAFYDRPDRRIAYFWGEGLWKWRLFSYREHGNHELFNTLIQKAVSYLAGRKGNERFINDIKPLYDEMEETIINVELYNESYELVNVPDVKMQLKYEEKDFEYIFNRNDNKYRINLGNLPAGEYAYSLKTNLKGEEFHKKGVFYVRTQNPEVNDRIANSQVLKNISEHSGGISTDRRGVSKMVDRIKSDSRFKTVYREEMKYMDLGEIQWLGLLLLVIVCIEWFLLKYFVD